MILGTQNPPTNPLAMLILCRQCVAASQAAGREGAAGRRQEGVILPQ